TGSYIEESQKLLNELAKAMLCLTDASRKEEYDFSLGRKTETAAPASGRRTFEDILATDRILTPDQLKKSQRYAEAVGIGLEMAIIQQKQAEPEKIMIAYAESEGLPFVNLDECPVDEYYAPQIDPNMARQYSFVPVMADMGKLILASPAPLSFEVAEVLQALFEMPVRSAICVPAQVNAAIAKYYPRDAVQVVVAKGKEAASAKAAPSANNQAQSQEQTKKKASKKAAPPKKPLSAEAKKQRYLITFMTFNFTFAIMVFGRMAMNPRLQFADLVPMGIVIGLIATVIGWNIGTSKGRKLDEARENEEE
ncbi:MAG: hypothetical protein Q4G59_01940, partial [Planctomycetia bacterium]|nr:hypothetical protein [Planctomycetia bacterium]